MGPIKSSFLDTLRCSLKGIRVAGAQRGAWQEIQIWVSLAYRFCLNHETGWDHLESECRQKDIWGLIESECRQKEIWGLIVEHNEVWNLGRWGGPNKGGEEGWGRRQSGHLCIQAALWGKDFKDMELVTSAKSCFKFSNQEGQLVTLTKAGGSAEGKPDGIGFKRGQEWRKEFQAANVDSCLEEKRSWGLGVEMRQGKFLFLNKWK